MSTNARHAVLTPGPWGPAWPGAVTAVKVAAPAFYATAYEVFLDGKSVGFVYSQRSGATTYWGSAASLDDTLCAASPNRTAAVEGLVTARSS